MASQHQQQYAPWPLYDLFIDVPHPSAASSTDSPPALVIGAPAPPQGAPPNNNNDSIEQELQKNMGQIARFAFPEFDQDNAPPQTQQPPPPVNRFDQYAMQPPAFQNYTFSLTLQSGQRVQGHVRRYLPCHPGSKTRYDVGRRGERALVILTRVTGADVIYSAVLKMVDAISSHKAATPLQLQNNGNEQGDPQQPQQQMVFLHDLFLRHQKLAREHAATPLQNRKSAVMLTIPNLEVGPVVGAQKFSMVDATHFLVPQALLLRSSSPESDVVSNNASTSILPLLRCLGVAHTLRLVCALLSERRTVLISASPTRLATCCKSAMAILAQGLLHWHHLYIPVLPPHLWEYLAAPYPYLIGMLASLTPRLAHTDGLGDVLIIDLDHNTMETRGIPSNEIERRIPDLLLNVNSDQYSIQQQLGASGVPQASAPQLLAQDLLELLKNDKKILHGESALASIQDQAEKATKAVKKTFLKFKEKSKLFLNKKATSYNENDPPQVDEPEPSEPPEVNSMSPDFIYTEGCRNEICEEEARLAFCAFFLSMTGDMRWYAKMNPGGAPSLDRDMFKQFKLAAGEGEQMSFLMVNFCQTQMLEEFAMMRIDEIRTRLQVNASSPKFLQCSTYHKSNNIDFNVLSIRRVSRQVSQGNASVMMQLTNARRMAMELTSKRAFEGDYNKMLADMVEQCRESSSVLFDVMTVVWIRMRDNRGLQWRHATHSLHILKNLLFHGPLAAVAEATDGLDKIRALKYYNGHRQTAICVQIRSAAAEVYSLIVDRAKLYNIRRVCINKRRSLRKQDTSRLTRDTRLLKMTSVTFQKVHAAMHPNAPRSAPVAPPAAPAGPRTPPPTQQQAYVSTPTFAVLPPAPAQQAPRSATAPVQQQHHGDLLGLQQSPAAQAASAASSSADIFGVFGGGQQQIAPAPASTGSDMLGMFGGMTLDGSGQPQQPASQSAPQQPPQQQPQQGQHHQQRPLQQYRSRGNSPTPPQQQARAQSHSPTPPFSQPQGNHFAGQPAGQYAPQQQQQQPPPVNQYPSAAHSPQRSGAPQYGQPQQQQHPGYGHPGQVAQPTPAGYQPQPGAPPAARYAPQGQPQVQQQGFHPVQAPPSSYGYQPQQSAQPGRLPAQQKPSQQGPFF